ncbi:hypothetical protein [Serratia marcescens]|uniref:hypothetical protein n=1 Tax=Serratia marcescens TaxID=615 RepID=UPI0011E87858|nr:hypothetical protein [Serratia marcescens]
MNWKVKAKIGSKTNRDKTKRPPRISKTVLNIIPIATYNEERGYYNCKNGLIIDIVQFVCKDLTTTNAQDIEFDIIAITKHFRTYAGDVKIISINIPTDCSNQIAYFTRKIERCKNNIQKKILQKKLNEEIWIEKNRLNKEFYYMFFSYSPENHEENLKNILNSLHQCGLVKTLDRDKKDAVLYKLNNKNRRN